MEDPLQQQMIEGNSSPLRFVHLIEELTGIVKTSKVTCASRFAEFQTKVICNVSSHSLALGVAIVLLAHSIHISSIQLGTSLRKRRQLKNLVAIKLKRKMIDLLDLQASKVEGRKFRSRTFLGCCLDKGLNNTLNLLSVRMDGWSR